MRNERPLLEDLFALQDAHRTMGDTLATDQIHVEYFILDFRQVLEIPVFFKHLNKVPAFLEIQTKVTQRQLRLVLLGEHSWQNTPVIYEVNVD